ncbi:hypothetical protein FACS189494_07170 [Spirochaetia bacterium]|nr:hypothetical protein FACS189494_07170 [Spirochaetia bacterium]
MMFFKDTLVCIAGLTVFKNLRQRGLLCRLYKILKLLNTGSPDITDVVEAWASFLEVFLDNPCVSFNNALYEEAIKDENPWTLAAEHHTPDVRQTTLLHEEAKTDLQRLSYIATFDLIELSNLISQLTKKFDALNAAYFIKSESEIWTLHNSGLQPEAKLWILENFMGAVRRNGAGIFSEGTFFYWKAKKGIKLASQADRVRVIDFSGYEAQREVVISNTRRFISGNHGANNMLLYGDRGTGKSATVKAVCNEFANQGLRLVEVAKKDLRYLPKIMAHLSGRALRFILFIDDLSFESGDTSFTTLKALLEGSIEAKPDNIVVYATSNRRHLVKENAGDRPQSHTDVRAFDTMQEQLSLADRFGITVIYTSPSQDEYLQIAAFIARKRGLPIPPSGSTDDELKVFYENALRWERWFNGRSPRTAHQYVDWLSGGEGFPWE